MPSSSQSHSGPLSEAVVGTSSGPYHHLSLHQPTPAPPYSSPSSSSFPYHPNPKPNPNTLAAFRSEASDLFSKTKGKEVPKGLLGLGDILDEYISLKEQQIMVDQEKWRVEIAFQGLQDVMRAYNLPQSPPSFLPAPNGAFCQRLNPGNGSPPQARYVSSRGINGGQRLENQLKRNRWGNVDLPSSSSSQIAQAASAPAAVAPAALAQAMATSTL